MRTSGSRHLYISSAAAMAIIFSAVNCQARAQNQEGKDGAAKRSEAKVASSKGIIVDKKITDSEKEYYKTTMKAGDKYSSKQAKVLNQIPGVNVTAKDLQESEVKKGVSLNPITWLFKPVIRLQEQSVHLEQQIMKLTGPISALQPGILKLDNRIVSVGKEIGAVRSEIGTVEEKIENVGNQLSAMRQDITAMRVELGEIKKPIVDLQGPIVRLHDPLTKIEKPISGIDSRLVLLDKELGDLKTLLSLVLTAIFISAGIIAVGTPVAAILIWRNKAKLLPKPTPQQIKEENTLARSGDSVD